MLLHAGNDKAFNEEEVMSWGRRQGLSSRVRA
jgi:hypothetical protein